MKQKLRTISLAFMLVLAPLARIVNARGQKNEARLVAKVKADIAKRVASRNTRVNLKLLNGTELKGRLDQVEDKEFTFSEDKTGKSFRLFYSEVREVKGRGLSTGAKIGIIAAVTVGLVVTVVAISLHKFDPFKNGVLR